MNKFFGAIGFVEIFDNTSPGVFREKIIEREYYGDVLTFGRSLSQTDNLNDNISVTNVISIIADPYALNHFYNIRYICWQGCKWKISNATVESPRLKLTLGGLYHDQT